MTTKMTSVEKYTPTQEDIDSPCQICGEIYDGAEAMIECEICGKWYHNACLEAKEIKADGSFKCKACLEKPKQGTIPKNPSNKPPRRKSSALTLENNEILKLKKKIAEQAAKISSLEEKQNDNIRKELRSSSDSGDSSSEDEDNKARKSISVKKKMNNRSRAKNATESTDNESDTSSTTQFSKFLIQQELKELPSFDGTATQWPVFYRAYKESKQLFSDSANRNRLQKALIGKALTSVSGLLLSPSTINEAIRMLKYRFGQAESLIQEAIQQALSAENPTEKYPETIVDYAMLIVTINANIEAVGDDEEKRNPMLIKSLADRLPYSLQKKWVREKRNIKGKGKSVSIQKFSRWLLEESQDYLDLMPVRTAESKSQTRGKKPINLHESLETANQTKPKSGNTSNIASCYKCSKNGHYISECEQFRKLNIEDRQEYVKANNLCLSCLKKGHRWRRCRSKKNKNGKSNIHELIRRPVKMQQVATTVDISDKEVKTLAHHVAETKTIFKIIPITIHGPSSKLDTFALLDDCASATLIEEEIADKLMLKGKIDPLTLGWTKEITSCEENSRRVKFTVSGRGNKCPRYCIKNARTVKHLALPKQNFNSDDILKAYPYLNNAYLAGLERATPTLLIGLDNANLMAPYEVKIDPKSKGPIATRTKLGWTVHGPEIHGQRGEKCSEVQRTFVICDCSTAQDEDIHSLVENYFSTENFGTEMPKPIMESEEDKRVMKILSETTNREGNRFTTGLLWKEHRAKMPNNYDMSLRRLISIENKMKKNSAFKEEYHNKIKDYIQKGYARKLSSMEVDLIKDDMWLLPHFGTSSKNKPKMRLVFDAKAQLGGISLNNQLVTGPDQYNSLLGVLFKFRQGEFAVAADIKEMFHQIRIKEEDKRYQCFLWRFGDKSQEPQICQMEVMIFGATCSPCSAQYVKNINAEEFRREHPRAVDGIIHNFYVDDYMDSFQSENEALKITGEVIEINRHGGFELRNVISNSQAVRNKFNEEHPGNRIVKINNPENDATTEKVLGMFWDTKTDELLFQLKLPQNKEGKVTKRSLLKIMMSVFDPLGLIAHYLVRAKIIFQEIWQRNISNWDECLPADISERWFNWLADLKRVEHLRIPRNYHEYVLNATRTELHIFTDAGKKAFSAVAYLRIESAEGEVVVCLISSKTKIASQKASKTLSMPRLELQGAVLGSRLAATVEKEHSIKIDQKMYWTDSQTVLSWLHTDNISFKPFVAHRVAEILENSNKHQWKYIPSKENPADDATKSNKEDPFDINSRWYQGPDFLKKNYDKWPVGHRCKNLEGDPEIRKIFVAHVPITPSQRDYEPVNPNNFSSWKKMLRITARIKRMLYDFNDKIHRVPIVDRALSQNEMEEAHNYHIKKAQIQSYPDEIKDLKKNQYLKIKSDIRELIPFLDQNGIMRMDGRIESSPIASYDMKNPIILNRKHPVTQLIIHDYHLKYNHQFPETIVNEIRTKFWIPQLRVAVKQCRKRCQYCKNRDAVPINPQMAKLPLARLQEDVGCFYNCGIDLFGPLSVINKRTLEKRWGVIYTCLASRAIYLDIVHDLTSDSLIMSIRTCNIRRGPIKHRYCDCGTNLKGAQRELKNALTQISDKELQEKCLEQSIIWHFNPPASPHMGGCWERMIRSVKGVLYTLMKERHVRDHTLRNFLCEIEDIINSRPLTYIALEKDNDDVLTPNHLLNPFFRTPSMAPGEFGKYDMVSRKQWRFVQEMTNHFWSRWVAEYLPMINRYTKWHEKVAPLQKDDVVIICDNTSPRNTCEKGRICEVKIAKDGQVRSATVKTLRGILQRPACKLAKLDVEPRMEERIPKHKSSRPY